MCVYSYVMVCIRTIKRFSLYANYLVAHSHIDVSAYIMTCSNACMEQASNTCMEQVSNTCMEQVSNTCMEQGICKRLHIYRG